MGPEEAWQPHVKRWFRLGALSQGASYMRTWAQWVQEGRCDISKWAKMGGKRTASSGQPRGIL